MHSKCISGEYSVGRIHPAWGGWSIDPKSGDLVTPLGWSLRTNEVLAMPLRYQHIAALECEVRELRERLASVLTYRHDSATSVVNMRLR